MSWKQGGVMINQGDKSAPLFLVFFLVMLTLVVPAQAQQQEARESEASSYRMDAIVFEGLLRTRRDVLARELLFKEGDIARIEEVELSVQRLRNTGIFRAVDYELIDQRIGAYGEEEALEGRNEQGRLLRITVDERWTLLPSFSFGHGGDTFQLGVGLQDVNFLGSFLQVGGRYSRMGQANSFALWFRDPRFRDKRELFSVETSLRNRLHSVYTYDGELVGGYLATGLGVGAALEKEWTDWVRSSIDLSLSADRFSYEMVADSRRVAQQERGGLPESLQTLRFGISSSVGKIDQFNYRYRGTLIGIGADQFVHLGGAPTLASRLELSVRHFSDLPLKSTLALRGVVGFSNIEAEHLQFYAGGLDTLRGTVDMRYRGTNYWLGNVEYRIPSFDLGWLILQHVFFLDAVGVRPYATSPAELSATTVGLGLRVIIPAIYGVVIRVDYALPILGADGPGLSVGGGQFF